MKRNFDIVFPLLIKTEGGFSNDPKDPGGVTNLGATQKEWQKWVGHAVTIEDMKALTQEDVKPFYKAKYWDAVRGDDLPSGVDYSIFDFAVNSGPERASIELQKIVGVIVDGKIGPNTLSATKKQNTLWLIEKISDSRLKFLMGLKNWSYNSRGWTKRIVEVEDKAKEMMT